MGTPSFAVPILEGLISNYHVQLVVCQPDRKKNRKGEVIIPDTKKIALANNIEVFQPEHIREDYQKISALQPDLIITCAYGQMIPQEIITLPKYGCINVHGSLLPDLRGGAPIHWAIIKGYKQTGVTVMSMSSKMDAGDIVTQQSIEITPDETLDSLYERMSYLGRDLLLKTLPSIIDKTCTYTKQDPTLVTFGLNIQKEEAHISFYKSASEIKNLVRGLCSNPGAYCYLDGKRFKIFKVDILNSTTVPTTKSSGEIIAVDKQGIICQCAIGQIKILELAVEGKKRCLTADYLNGISKDKLIGKVFN